jgi:hypothetical protein
MNFYIRIVFICENARIFCDTEHFLRESAHFSLIVVILLPLNFFCLRAFDEMKESIALFIALIPELYKISSLEQPFCWFDELDENTFDSYQSLLI